MVICRSLPDPTIAAPTFASRSLRFAGSNPRSLDVGHGKLREKINKSKKEGIRADFMASSLSADHIGPPSSGC